MEKAGPRFIFSQQVRTFNLSVRNLKHFLVLQIFHAIKDWVGLTLVVNEKRLELFLDLNFICSF